MENTFRSAVFGGFNRQDVMDYIAKTAAEHAESIHALEEERDQLETAAAEKDVLANQLSEKQELCAQLEERLAGTEEKLSHLTGADEANTELTEKVSALEKEADEYRALKEHIAQIELDAHKRADEIIAQAQKRAEELINEAELHSADIRDALRSDLTEVSTQYITVHNDFDKVKEHIVSELRKMNVAIEQLPLALDHFDTAFGNILDRANGTAPTEE